MNDKCGWVSPCGERAVFHLEFTDESGVKSGDYCHEHIGPVVVSTTFWATGPAKVWHRTRMEGFA